MKRAFFILGILVVGLGEIYGQQVPLYSLYHHNQFVYNPARAGFNESPEIYVMYRKQWLGFDGAPETRAISFDMPVKKTGGIGAYVFNDLSDIFNRWGGYLSYAYRIKFKNENHKLSLGLAAGVQDYRIEVGKINVKDSNDPLLMNDLSRGTSFDGSAGINYFVTDGGVKKTKAKTDSTGMVTDSASTKELSHSILNFNIGISALSVYGTDLKFLNNNDESTYYRPARQYVASISNRFKLVNEKFILEPMVLARMTEALNYQIDAGLLLGYKDWVWISGTYRYDYGVTVAGGFKVHDAVKIGYAYDLPINEIKDYTKGTHELMLGITFGKKKDKKMQEAIEELQKKVADQDSIVNDMQTKQDSLLNEIENLNNKVDSLSEVLASGEFEVMDEMGGDIDPDKMRDINNLSEAEWKSKYGDEDYDKYKKISDASKMSESAWKSKYGDEDYDQYKAQADRYAEFEKRADALEKRIKDLEGQIDKAMKKLDTKVKDMKTEMTEERTRVVSEEDLEYKKGTRIGDYFMVVGSFRIEDNSYKFEEDLVRRGYEAGVVYDKKRQWYYVYIAQPTDLRKGLEDLYKLREETPEFHDAWIHIMQKSLK